LIAGGHHFLEIVTVILERAGELLMARI